MKGISLLIVSIIRTTGEGTTDDLTFTFLHLAVNALYYMATIVRPLCLTAEWALFSCNDRAL